MKAWRQLKTQENVRFELYDALPEGPKGEALRRELVRRGVSRFRVGHITRKGHVQFKAVPSPLFQRMMIHVGLAPKP